MPAAVDKILFSIKASLRKTHPHADDERLEEMAIAIAVSRGLIHSSGGHLKLGKSKKK